MVTAHRPKISEAPEFKARIMRGPTASSSRGVAFTEPAADRRPGWHIIIADRSEARLYEADGGISRLKLLGTTRNPAARQHERDLVSGRAGNKFNRTAGSFQALSAPDTAQHEQNERFAKAVADVALQCIADGGRLALVAAPRTLGEILRALPPRARARVSMKVPRDLTHARAAELRTRLKDALATAH
jgi:protein required for attachment to host cells